MKSLRNILMGACIVAMAACNDQANDASNNDGSVGGSGDTANKANTDTNTGTGTTALAEKDAQFLSEAAAMNMAEVKMGQLAQQKGQHQDVKDIGKLMETDHSAALSDVRTFASNRSATIPTEEREQDKSMHNMLNGKSGKEFDKDWCGHMITAHQEAITKFEAASNELADAELKTWAANMLPKLRTHLQRLNECNNKLK